jgi:hypothetical protein
MFHGLHADLMSAIDVGDHDRAKALMPELRGLALHDLSGHLDYLSRRLEAMGTGAGAADTASESASAAPSS